VEVKIPSSEIRIAGIRIASELHPNCIDFFCVGAALRLSAAAAAAAELLLLLLLLLCCCWVTLKHQNMLTTTSLEILNIH
jgi:hypothetical protein